jgi:hypothetical protein
VDVHIHYSFEPENASTRVTRWQILDISMPAITRPLRRLILSAFDKEIMRTMAAAKKYAEAHAGDAPAAEHGETGNSATSRRSPWQASQRRSPTIPPGTQK